MNEALFSIDTKSNLQFGSTFTAGSFELTNNFDSQEDIVSITLDLSSAIFSDLVFDPIGNAGDTTAKGFEFDSQNDEGNTVSISNYPFSDPAAPFSSVRNGGYDVLTLDFASFQPGQTLRFSADVDPTSIQGSDDPGPSDSGSISGLELVGATVTVKFADDTELTGQVYRTSGSEVASEVTLAAEPQAAPEIEAIGFDGAATVDDANQTIRVTGNAGAEVSLLIVEGGFYTGGGGVDPDPDAFEANRALVINEQTDTIGDDGFVDINVNLTYTDVDGSGGLNYIVAKYQGNSLISDRVILEYNPDGTTDPGTIDPGTIDPGTGTVLPDGTIRIEAEDYKANIDGQQYFDFDPENRSGEYRVNEPVDIETTTDVGGGFNVSFIQSGEFLTYDVNVAEAGTYNVVLRVASPSEVTQSAEVLINGQSYAVEFAPTGGWQEYQDVVVANVNLEAGTQELRFEAKSSEFNFNYINLVPGEPVVDTAAPTAMLNTASASTAIGTAGALTFTVTYSDDNALNAATIDANDLTVTAADGTEMAVSLVGVDAGTATYAIAASGGTWELAEAGDYTVSLKTDEVSDTAGNFAAAAVLGTFNVDLVEPNEPQTGDGRIRIQAEDYKADIDGQQYFDFDPENLSGEYRPNEPVDIETTSDVGGGFNVSFIQSGEFLTYDVNVAEAGTYNVVLRVASPSEVSQSAEVLINGQTYTVDFEPTGDWQTYQDVVVANVSLEAGTQELRFEAKSSEFNFNYIDLVADEPVIDTDTTPPTAVLNTTTVSQPVDATAAATFTITYSDDTAIDETTIDANDLSVTAPDGTEMAVSFVGIENNTATYEIAAPDGSWDLAEAGNYTVSLKAGEVSDTSGNTTSAAELGSLNITIEPGEPEEPVDTTPPTAVLNTATVSQPVDATAAATFTVTYSDATAINEATIDANDLTVTAPDGTEVEVSLVGVDAGTATYEIAAPGGSWNRSEAGDYTVSLKAGEVSDTSGNTTSAAVLGTVNLTVTGDVDVVEPAETIRIEAEDYNTGMNGVAYLDTSSGNFGGAYGNDHVDVEITGDDEGGYNVGWVQKGEFLTYDVNVAEAGTYDIVLRVAANADAQSLDVTIGGQTYAANFDSTGGSQTYTNVEISDVNLAAGSQQLRLDMKSNSFNLNYIDLVPQDIVVVDETAPTAVLNTPFVATVVGTADAPIFTVTYSDDSGIDATTIDADDLSVTAPDGTEMAVSLVGINAGVATYAFAAPGGIWDLAEAGDYTVSLKAGAVSDTSGNTVAATDLGSLNIYFEDELPTDTTPPTAVLNTATISQSVDSTTAATFAITYSDDNAVDSTTIDANDLTVTAPDGTEIAVTLVGVNAGTATYAIAAPNGTWDTANAGAYSIAVKAGEIADLSGNEIGAVDLGSLTINVPDNQPNPEAIRIEAENYKANTEDTEYYFDFNAENLGGAYRLEEAVDVEVTGDVDGDFNVGFIQSGEFLTYDVNVTTAGEYNIVLRVAADEDAQSLEIVTGEQTYTAEFDFTGGFQTYIDVVIPNVTLAAGEQELRLNATSSAFNLNYFELIPTEDFVDGTAPTATLNTINLTKQPDTNLPANFTVNFSDNVSIDAASIDGNDVTVTAPDGTVLTTSLAAINNNSNGNLESATYFFDAPGGTWDAADTGSYTVNLNAEEVADPSGNFAAAASLGSFGIDVFAPVDDGAIRINAGANVDDIDINNKLWLADVNFTNGQSSIVGDAIDNTTDDFIYQSQRAGDNFSYSIPVEDGNYKVNLHLAELDFGDAGFRQFDASLEGELVLDNYDIWANTKNAQRDGGDTAKVQEISDLLIVRDGAIDLDFTSVANNATVAGIEIVPIEGAQALILESGEGTLVTEGGNSDTYQILLNSQPTADVTINLQPDAQTNVDQNTLTFTPENWSVPQTVTVNAVDDDASENFSSPATITHTISTTDSTYANVEIADVNLQVIDNDATDAEIKFDQKVLDINLGGKTTGAWGPDGRFYVGSRDGIINAYTFDDNYNVTDTQTITTLQNLPNREILGIAFNPFENDGSDPKLYVSHSELYANEYTYEREGGSGFNELVDFSPYSGEVSVLSGEDFAQREIVVDNLGVSNHDHGINGLTFDGNGDLLIAVGSNTNAGIPDDDIGGLDESPFTAAIIKAEITKPDFNGNIQYQLPADWVAPEGLQVDPVTSQGFGGIVDVAPGVDVSVYAPGLRNSYDLVYSTKGILYATENDANSGFGDYSTSATTQEPFNLDPQNEINIVEEGKYYGNPNRNRGRQEGQDRQNVYYPSYDSSNDEYTGPIRQHGNHIHGITEYRSTTFSEQLRGDLLTIELDSNGGTVMNVELTADGRGVENLVGLKTQATGGESLTQGLDVVTGFGGSIIGINYFGDVTAAVPVSNITTATAYEIDEWRAPASGGGTFTIGGVNFSELGDTTVTIGNEVATIESVSDKRIFGTLPAFGAEYTDDGLLDITVNSGGEVSTITDAFLPLFG